MSSPKREDARGRSGTRDPRPIWSNSMGSNGRVGRRGTPAWPISPPIRVRVDVQRLRAGHGEYQGDGDLRSRHGLRRHNSSVRTSRSGRRAARLRRGCLRGTGLRAPPPDRRPAQSHQHRGAPLCSGGSTVAAPASCGARSLDGRTSRMLEQDRGHRRVSLSCPHAYSMSSTGTYCLHDGASLTGRLRYRA